jgi:hypothetical protein
MKKTVLVMLYEIRATLGRKTFMVLALGVPLVLGVIALIVMVINRDASSAPLASTGTGTSDVVKEMAEGYVDEGDLIEALPAEVPSGWLTEYPDEAAALEAKEIAAYYIIPADYVETGDIVYATLQHNPISDRVNTDGIERIMLLNLLGDAELAAGVWNPLDVQETALEAAEAEAADR